MKGHEKRRQFEGRHRRSIDDISALLERAMNSYYVGVQNRNTLTAQCWPEDNGNPHYFGADNETPVLVLRAGKAWLLDSQLGLCKHSPDGFSWGYCGSGCAQLSFAILMDIFRDEERVRRVYQRVKETVVARIPMEENWVLPAAVFYHAAVDAERELKHWEKEASHGA